MTILKPAPVSTALFTYNGDTGVLVGEMSDLGVDFGPVYDDACDVGLTVVSALTGTEIVFAVSHVEVRDDELLFWDLLPVGRVPATARNVRLRIFND